MAQALQKQITLRLKRKNCQQKDCRNNNQDNIELIVFGNNNLKRTGLMCSQCLMDSELLEQIKPVQKHSISIKKFMKTLTLKYQEYSQQKNSVSWGPNILQNQNKQIKQLLNSYEQVLFKGILQIVKFVEDIETRTLEQIKNLHKDISFQKLVQLLAEQDEEQQEKMNVSVQLKSITSNIMQLQGQYKMSNQSQLKEKHEIVMQKYRKNVSLAKQALISLIDVQKKALKQLTIVDVGANK